MSAATLLSDAPRCATCGGEGTIDDPAHPTGGSYEDWLFAGPPKQLDCPACHGTGRPPVAA